MKRKILVFISTIILSFTILTSKVYAAEPISTITNTYKEGIYQLNKNEKDKYTLSVKFTENYQNVTVLILNKEKDLLYKSKYCHDIHTVSDIVKEDTIVIIGEGVVYLEFTKSKE